MHQHAAAVDVAQYLFWHQAGVFVFRKTAYGLACRVLRSHAGVVWLGTALHFKKMAPNAALRRPGPTVNDACITTLGALGLRACKKMQRLRKRNYAVNVNGRV